MDFGDGTFNIRILNNDTLQCYGTLNIVVAHRCVLTVARKCSISCAYRGSFWKTMRMIRTLIRFASECPIGALKVLYNEGVRVEYDSTGRRNKAYDGERQVGECNYLVGEAGRDIVHTETDPAYRGKEISKRLVYVVLEQAEKQKVKIIPSCSYAKKVLDE